MVVANWYSLHYYHLVLLEVMIVDSKQSGVLTVEFMFLSDTLGSDSPPMSVHSTFSSFFGGIKCCIFS